MVQILPNRTTMKNIQAIKLGLVFDPALLAYPRSVANQLMRKVVQAHAYATNRSMRVVFVIVNPEAVEFARYVDAMNGTAVSSVNDQFVTYVIPQEEAQQVDAFIVFRGEESEFSFTPDDTESEAEITEVEVKVVIDNPVAKKTEPFSVPIPKARQLTDPYENMHVPENLFVQKVPETFKEMMLDNIPDIPETTRPGDIV